MCRKLSMKNSFLKKEIKISTIKGVIKGKVNKIKKIIDRVKNALSENKNLITTFLIASLFWISLWAIDEVGDTEKHTKLKTEHSILIENFNSLVVTLREMEKQYVQLQKVIHQQGIIIHKAENALMEQKKIIEDLTRRLYSTENDTRSWASHEKR